MGTLAVFQVYFMLFNVTMSKIIDQFRVIHRSEENEISSGSKNKKPFSRGLGFNLYQYWVVSFRKELANW